MKTTILVAVIAAFPPTLAAILAYLASTRTLRRAVGPSDGVPLATIVARLEHKIDRLVEGQVAIRERLARLEGAQAPTVPTGAIRPPAQGGRGARG